MFSFILALGFGTLSLVLVLAFEAAQPVKPYYRLTDYCCFFASEARCDKDGCVWAWLLWKTLVSMCCSRSSARLGSLPFAARWALLRIGLRTVVAGPTLTVVPAVALSITCLWKVVLHQQYARAKYQAGWGQAVAAQRANGPWE